MAAHQDAVVYSLFSTAFNLTPSQNSTVVALSNVGFNTPITTSATATSLENVGFSVPASIEKTVGPHGWGMVHGVPQDYTVMPVSADATVSSTENVT